MKGRVNMSYPTSEQLYALELAARRARSAEIARLVNKGARVLKAAIGRAVHALNVKGPSHA
jgi:hypothetical protein